MDLRKPFAACFTVLPGLLALLAAGCAAGQPKGPAKDPEAVHIEKVAQLANHEYPDAHHGKRPKDLNELKSWAVKEGKADEADFKSTRDDQPYALANGIVHEQTGVNGKLFAVPPGATAANEMDSMGIQYMGGGSGMPKAGRQGMPGPPR